MNTNPNPFSFENTRNFYASHRRALLTITKFLYGNHRLLYIVTHNLSSQARATANP